MPGVPIRALLFVQLERDEGLPFFDAFGASDQRSGAKYRATGEAGASKRSAWTNPLSAGNLCRTVAGCGTYPASD